ncbi:phage major capsid protein [Priestia aryabhattai]|uniref:phage major capsid protein n=1 Tax=Priestia aryabhattai TaxID=412384 RepID=UPI003C86A8DB
MKTLYELKQNLTTVGAQLKKTEDSLASAAIDPNKTTEDIQQLQKSRDDLQMRFNVIKNQHDQMEKEQQERIQQQERANLSSSPSNPAEQKVQAKANLIRATIRQQAVSSEIRAALGDENTTGGNKFLPKTVSTEILTEPTTRNPLRKVSTITQITNLEIPKLNYTLDDDGFISDTETAKELKLTGDVVAFGRHKFKVFAGVSETVLNGSDANLVSSVETALNSGVAAKEKKVAFTTTPKPGEEHMSFYASGVKQVSGINKYKAIKNAIADLHEDYRENATIMMRYADYMDIIETLANGNATLYSAQPEQVLGKPTEFSDLAVDPIVGDFEFSHFNYDLEALYERDKDIKTGVEQFVVTAWFDHQIKLKSAFRIAKEDATPEV